jgi:hypothetical protein
VAGDCRRGQSLIVWAIDEGRQAAREIDMEVMGVTNLPVTGGVKKSFVPLTHSASPPSSRFGPLGAVLGAQEVLTIVNQYGRYFSGPDNILGGPKPEIHTACAQASLNASKRMQMTDPSSTSQVDRQQLS